jgi:hypothetical protein
MNKMLADGVLVRKGLECGAGVAPCKVMRRRSTEGLRGMDGVGQAAMIAKQLDHLTGPQKDCTIGQYMNWVLPCECRNPCCSGYRKNPPWAQAIGRLCTHLKETAELSRIKGRKGLSTHPIMRLALVERFFVPGKTIILADLAEQCSVTPQTVITHKKPIEQHLKETLDDAVIQLDQILSNLGIVGEID